MNEFTRILSAIDQGDPHAAEQLLPLVYDELRRLAAQKVAPAMTSSTSRSSIRSETCMGTTGPAVQRDGSFIASFDGGAGEDFALVSALVHAKNCEHVEIV